MNKQYLKRSPYPISFLSLLVLSACGGGSKSDSSGEFDPYSDTGSCSSVHGFCDQGSFRNALVFLDYDGDVEFWARMNRLSAQIQMEVLS